MQTAAAAAALQTDLAEVRAQIRTLYAQQRQSAAAELQLREHFAASQAENFLLLLRLLEQLLSAPHAVPTASSAESA